MRGCVRERGVTYPAIVVLVQEAHQLARCKPQLVLHGRLEVELDAVDVGSGRAAGHGGRAHRGGAELRRRGGAGQGAGGGSLHGVGRLRALDAEGLGRLVPVAAGGARGRGVGHGTGGSTGSEASAGTGTRTTRGPIDGRVGRAQRSLGAERRRFGVLTEWVGRVAGLRLFEIARAGIAVSHGRTGHRAAHDGRWSCSAIVERVVLLLFLALERERVVLVALLLAVEGERGESDQRDQEEHTDGNARLGPTG